MISALEKLSDGAFESFWGRLSMSEVQICPQNSGRITESLCDSIVSLYPDTTFRLHANARVDVQHRLWDASCFSEDSLHYFKQLAFISHYLKSPAYSLHAGYKENASLDQVLEYRKSIQDIFGDIPVALEGLYPSKNRPQLMDTWKDYEKVFNSGAFIAIDFSHLQIVAKSEGSWEKDLVLEMVTSKQCLEVHVSDNNGFQDNHFQVRSCPSWMDILSKSSAVCFSEGRLL